MAKKLKIRSRVPLTRKQGYAAAASLLRRAMDTLRMAHEVAPDGLNDLSAVVAPHAEAMERAEAAAVDDGTVYYPEATV